MATIFQKILDVNQELAGYENKVLFNKQQCLRIMDRIDFIVKNLKQLKKELLNEQEKLLKDLLRQINRAESLILQHIKEETWINTIAKLTINQEIFQKQNKLLQKRALNFEFKIEGEWGTLPEDQKDENFDYIFIKKYVENILENSESFQEFFKKYKSFNPNETIELEDLKEDIQSELQDIEDLRPKDNFENVLKVFSNTEIMLNKFLFSDGLASWYLGTFKETKVIIKQLIQKKGNNKKILEKNKKEAITLTSLNHPNIIKCIGIVLEPKFSIIIQIEDGGLLFNYLNSQKSNLPLSLCLDIASKIANSMYYLHTNNIFHGFLNSKGVILIEKDSKIIPININFGMTDFDYDPLEMSNSEYILPYLAPEVLRMENISYSADIYSFGILLFELITKKEIYPNISNYEIIRKHFLMSKDQDENEIEKENNEEQEEEEEEGEEQEKEKKKSTTENLPFRPCFPTSINNNIKQLISDCWTEDPESRPSFRIIYRRINEIIDELKKTKKEIFQEAINQEKIKEHFFTQSENITLQKKQEQNNRGLLNKNQISFSNLISTKSNVTLPSKPKYGGNLITVGKGKECETIGQALVKARYGDRIDIEPGIYFEQLIINTNEIEIVGLQNENNGVIIEYTKGSVLSFQSKSGSVSNITFRKRGAQHFAVEIISGNLEMHNCDISGDGAACLGISRCADPVITNCFIHHGNVGCALFNKAKGNFDNCSFFVNKFQGICITGNSNPIIENSTIFWNKDSGIQIRDKSKGTIRNCDIFYNELNGVETTQLSSPRFENCKIYENQQNGFAFFKANRPVLLKNIIYSNNKSGISCNNSAPIVKMNQIYLNKETGIFLYKKSTGEFNGNKIYKNKLSGVQIQNNSDPIFDSNSIYENFGSGFIARSNSLGNIQNNKIHHNNKRGIDVESGSDTKFLQNSITENDGGGVLVCVSGKGQFTQNKIDTNKVFQFRIMKKCFPVLKNNDIPKGVQNDNNK
ncbi:f-box only protein [Anaeramoeba flamelloides]|uniref:F-box only protein n=1 Tax=Anaeramoeba flamelloides TaxID=1746091 RepID=A0AAV7YV55_9EUKA|nr:f-box only protein [Anaeramoeba flamelloides]